MVVWQPGTEGSGVTDVLFTDAAGQVRYPVKGRLSFSWPARPDQSPLNLGEPGYEPLFPYGYGLSYGQECELADNLSEEGLQLPDTEEVWELFKYRPLDAWQIEAEGGVNDRAVMTGNRLAVSTVSIDSVDRDVQEDARRVRWNGEGFGLVSLATRDRQVLTDYWRSKGAVVVDLKVDEAPSEAVQMRVGCGPSAVSEIDIGPELRDLAGQGWQTLVVGLDRFPDVGSDFGLVLPPEEFFTRVLEPFSLATEGALDLTFSGVRIEKNRV